MLEKNTQQITITGILAALAWIISIFSFPLLYWAPFLKIDFSDIPVLLGMYLYGPITGIGIAGIRSFLSYATSGGEAGFPIGDTSAFFASLSYTLPVYFIIKKKLDGKRTLLASISGTLSLTFTLSLLNLWVILPLYLRVMNFDVGPVREYLVMSLVPFNLLKGTLVSITFFTVFRSLYNHLQKIKKQNDIFITNIN